VAETLKDIPVVVWLVLAAVALAAVRYVTLLLRRARTAPAAQEALRRLDDALAALRGYAAEHDGALPDSLAGVAPEAAEWIVYRPVPSRAFDERLILVYDRGQPHLLVEFPMLRAGRAVGTLGGKRLILSEQQFEKLLAADNRLRVTCGLEGLPPEASEATSDHE
jgi:hypothetical protein